MVELRKILITLVLLFVFSNLIFGSKTLDRFNDLLAKYQLEEAEEFLKEKGVHLKKKILKNCFIRLGEAFFLNRQYIKALSSYRESPYQGKKEKKVIKWLSELVGDEYLVKRDYEKALEYYKISGNREIIDKLVYIRSGDESLSNGEYKQALEYYEKSGCLDKIAGCYGVMADDHKKQGNIQLAKFYLKKAIEKYESILKSFDYWWCDEYNKHRLRCMEELNSFEKSPEEKTQEIKLKKILKGVGKYCDRLKKKSIYFFCKEYVKETIDYSILGNNTSLAFGIKDRFYRKNSGIKSESYIYAYQLIRDGNLVNETRKLLWNTGRRSRSAKRNEWETKSIIFKKIIFGPPGIFGFSWQSFYDYKIRGEDTFNREKVIIVESIPKFPLKINPKIKRILLFGKAWIKADDFTILKIEWEPKSIGNTNNLRKVAKRLNLKPNLTFITEYLFERDGIRYPTKGYYEEYFVNKKGKKSTLLTLDISYEKFKFFNVGTEVKNVKVSE